MPTTEALLWLDQLAISECSIDTLVAEGYSGFSLADIIQWLSQEGAAERFSGMAWVKTTVEKAGEVALLTKDSEALDQLLDWMLKCRGECPKVFAPDNCAVAVPIALPVLRPTAFNLPAGLASDDVLDDELLECVQDVFDDLRTSFGNQACLHRFDYGTFVDHVERHKVIFLTGQFIDLDTREIYEFTMDGLQQRMRYQSTCTFLPVQEI